MLHNERQQKILNVLKNRGGSVSVKHLSDLLYASESSIRRDLNALANQGLVKHVYGGAQLLENFSHFTNADIRHQRHVSAKRAIARKATTLVSDGSVIFLDQSSTAFYLAEALSNRSALTVITNNIEILMLLSRSNLNVISVGGQIGRENRNCLLGGDAFRIFEETYANFVFFSTCSLSQDGVISDCDRDEILVRNVMLHNAEKIVYLCDSSKFNSRSAYKQCTLNDVDVLVSDVSPEGHIQLEGVNIEIL